MKILSFLFVIPVMAIALPADQLLSRSKGPGYFHVMEAWNGQSGTHSSAIGISLVMSSVYNCTGFLDNLDMGISGKSVDAAAGHLASWFHSNNGICGKKDLDFWLNNTDSQKPTFSKCHFLRAKCLGQIVAANLIIKSQTFSRATPRSRFQRAQ
jgi:hypothetical protein